MKISCCIPGGSFMPQGEKEVPMSPMERLSDGYRVMRELGYDAAEATVGLVMALTEDDVAVLREQVACGAFRLDACNSFIPGHLPIVCDDEGTRALYAYVDEAIARMASLGVRYVVFGSGRVRSIPEGADTDAALAHAREMLSESNAFKMNRS